MSSRGTTTLSSFGQMYCCLTRVPHLECSMLKEIPAELSAAENSLTGMETSPNEIFAVPIARALIGLKCRPVLSRPTIDEAGGREARPYGTKDNRGPSVALFVR